MREDKARALGHEPLAYVRSYAYAALDPGEQLLQGPALAMPVALARAGLAARDIDLIEIHEAFAAQVLCNLKAFASRAWAERAGFDEPVGELDRDRINVMGGSVALGHPFGATGARVLTTLCRELARRGTGRTLYILDEPTTGLHFADIRLLLEVLHQLCDAGNTVVVIEHNLDVIKTADWLIDMGPEGGAGGGLVLCTGTPEDIAAAPNSHTGRFLRPMLALTP